MSSGPMIRGRALGKPDREALRAALSEPRAESSLVFVDDAGAQHQDSGLNWFGE